MKRALITGIKEAFGYVGLDRRPHVEVDPKYFRPLDADSLVADISTTKSQLGGQPNACLSFEPRRHWKKV